MSILESQKKEYIKKIKSEYLDDYDIVKWISPEEIISFTEKRDNFLSCSGKNFFKAAGNTKPYSQRLSPGCCICKSGEWSCLFITGICNGTCFYCPAPQNEDLPPVSQNIEFASPEDYADYIEKMGFKGASISGGEPLIKFEKSLEFIKTLKNRFGNDFHTWLYTNGILGSRDKFKKLKEAGLDEIRFDIGAVEYSLEMVKTASEFFENLTVEIPAVPEEKELLKSKLSEMEEAGVKFLNLHQLRLTPYNFKNLTKRDYTYSHGLKAVVIESELMALELIDYCIEKNIDVGINYCSFVYKNRYQSAAWRIKGAKFLKETYDDITENGYLRRVSIQGTDSFLNEKAGLLLKSIGKKGWELKKEKLYLRFDLLSLIASDDLKIDIEYFEPRLLPFISYYYYFKDIKVNDHKNISVERVPALAGKCLDLTDYSFSKDIDDYEKISSMFDLTEDKIKISKFEKIEKELQDYF